MAEEDFNDPELAELLDSTLEDFDKLPTVKVSEAGDANVVHSKAPINDAGVGAFSPTLPEDTDEAAFLQKILGDLQTKMFDDNDDVGSNSADFTQLMSAMEEIMNEMNTSSLPGGESAQMPELDELQNMFKDLHFADISEPVAPPTSKASKPARKSPKTKVEDGNASSASEVKPPSTNNQAQNTIMDCLKSLSEALPNLQKSSSTDPLGGGADASLFNGFLSNMLKKLLDKELIYPSLKPLCDGYPDWLRENESKLNPTELEQRKKQAYELTLVCQLYEENAEAWKNNNIPEQHLMSLMEHIEAAMRDGSPPEDLIQATDDADASLPMDSQEHQENLQRLLQMTSGTSTDGAMNPDQCSLM